MRSRLMMRHFLAVALAYAICAPSAMSSDRLAVAEEMPHKSLYSDDKPFLSAIEAERPRELVTIAPTGLIVPHHTVAADLIARAFWTTKGASYDRVIVVSPDHYRRSRHVMATTPRPFDTPFGKVSTDARAVERLLTEEDLVERSDLFDREHGVAALLPFVRWFLPDAPVVGIVLQIGSTPDEWRRAADAIAKIVTPRTLVVQSTDFSHYLRAEVAAQRDQESLMTLAAGEPEGAIALHQSDHLDSRASLFVQLSLQARTFGSRGVVIGNRNQVEYAPLAATSSTSYVAMVFARDPTILSKLRYDDQKLHYFGGDFFAGRWLAATLGKPQSRDFVINAVRRITAGAPMIVNLEGALLQAPPPVEDADLHVMDALTAVPILRELNVIAAGVANNHAWDLGRGGAAATLKTLRESGIKPLRHLEPLDMGVFRLIAINYIGVQAFPHYPAVRGDDIASLCRMALRPPVIAFVHWGEEYTSLPPPAVLKQAEALRACGVTLVVGAHSHQAAKTVNLASDGANAVVYSLGNLLFDQHGPRSTGALLEVRSFRQGTIAVRLIPAPNLFDALVPSSRAVTR